MVGVSQNYPWKRNRTAGRGRGAGTRFSAVEYRRAFSDGLFAIAEADCSLLNAAGTSRDFPCLRVLNPPVAVVLTPIRMLASGGNR